MASSLARLPSLALLLVVVAAAGGVGCASPTLEDADESAGAISGDVEVGTEFETLGDALRLRRTPSKEDSKNILGLLPTGTKVKILEGAPNNGFYKVEVTSEPIASELPLSKGWVYGEYLKGDAEEPPVTEEEKEQLEESTTGTHEGTPTVALVNFVVDTACASKKDDKGKAMAPSLDEALAGTKTYAVVGIDTNTFSYGMRASLEELDKVSDWNPEGKKIPLKVMKTLTTQAPAGFTVTLCASAAAKEQIKGDADGKMTLSVYGF